MAQIRDRLRRGAGGQLFKTTEEGIQSLSKKAGLPSSPTTPVGASSLGANPDVAKMQSTPNQLRQVLAQSSGAAPSLQQRMRQQQVRTGATAEEQAQMQAGARLGDLTALDERVQALAASQVEAASGTQLQGREAAAGFTGDIKEALEKLDDPNLTEVDRSTLMMGLNKSMGRGTDNPITEQELQTFYKSSAEQAGQALAGGLEQVNVTQLPLEEMGFEGGGAEVAQLLGLTEEQLATMGVRELIDATQGAIEGTLSQAQGSEETAQDPLASPAERAEARRQLKDAGAVGTYTAESELDKLADQIENADTVTFAGEEVQIEQLLGDEYLSAKVANLVDTLDDPGRRAEWEAFKEQEPALAQWVESNKNTLDEASKTISGAQKEFTRVNDWYRGLDGAGALTAEEMQDLLPEGAAWPPSDFIAREFDVSDFLDTISDPRASQAERVSLAGSYRTAPSKVVNLSRQEIDEFDLGDASSPKRSQVLQNMKSSRLLDEALEAQDEDAWVTALTGGEVGSKQELVEALKVPGGMAKSPFFAGVDLEGLRFDERGNLDEASWGELKANMQARFAGDAWRSSTRAGDVAPNLASKITAVGEMAKENKDYQATKHLWEGEDVSINKLNMPPNIFNELSPEGQASMIKYSAGNNPQGTDDFIESILAGDPVHSNELAEIEAQGFSPDKDWVAIKQEWDEWQGVNKDKLNPAYAEKDPIGYEKARQKYNAYRKAQENRFVEQGGLDAKMDEEERRRRDQEAYDQLVRENLAASKRREEEKEAQKNSPSAEQSVRDSMRRQKEQQRQRDEEAVRRSVSSQYSKGSVGGYD